MTSYVKIERHLLHNGLSSHLNIKLIENGKYKNIFYRNVYANSITVEDQEAKHLVQKFLNENKCYEHLRY